MAERDDARVENDGRSTEEMRQRLDVVASGIDVGALEQARTDVGKVVRRRRTRKRAGAVLGAAAVVAVAATTVVLTVGGGEPDTLVTTDDTMPPVTVAEADAEAPEPTLSPAFGTTQPVELIDVTARSGSAAGVNGAPEYSEWMVPWEDGFLVGTMWSPPQPLPDELPEDVRDLFPQEVIDFFGGDLPDTIAEATAQLSEAGLLDVVSEVIQENPAAYDAIYGVPTEAPTLEVRFTVDGTTWEPREMVLPPGASYLAGVTAVDGRLAAVYGNQDQLSGQAVDGTITVASTTDLSNWTTQQIVVPSPGELPEWISWNVYPEGLVANDGGWVLAVSDSVDADPFALLPADIRTQIESDGVGFGVRQDVRGITIEYGFDVSGNNPSETWTFTWDELGVAPEVVELLDQQRYEPTLWAATWDGVPAPADRPPMGGQLAATPAGFLMWSDQTWFSPDGISWIASALPGDAGWVSGAFNIEGGLVVIASTDTGETAFHRVDERGANPVPLDLPLPADAPLSVGGPFPGNSMASGTVIDASSPVVPAGPVIVEADGYRLSIAFETGIYEVVDVATGELVVAENPFGPGSEDTSIRRDEAGVTVTDAATGEMLVLFPSDVLAAAEAELFGAVDEYEPDLWIVASLDGERFVVEDIADVTDGPTSLATNADRLLLQSGAEWVAFVIA